MKKKGRSKYVLTKTAKSTPIFFVLFSLVMLFTTKSVFTTILDSKAWRSHINSLITTQSSVETSIHSLRRGVSVQEHAFRGRGGA